MSSLILVAIQNARMVIKTGIYLLICPDAERELECRMVCVLNPPALDKGRKPDAMLFSLPCSSWPFPSITQPAGP